MKLFVLRHGKAVRASENQYDVDRELSKKGIGQIEKMGQYLQGHDIGTILSSSAKRTLLTSLGVNKYLRIDDVHYQDDLYLASADIIHASISALNTSKDLLYVGHNFGISQLVTYYTGVPILLSTGMLAIIEFDFDSSGYFSMETGQLIDTIKPKLIDFEND